MVDKSLLNVVLLGVSFMLIFTAFQTMGNIQKTIMTSITKEDPSFDAVAYYSLAIIYAFFSICNWAAPSVISVIGPKISMGLGGITYLLFIMNFLIPKTWLLYLLSAVVGVGAPMIWTGQGNYLTLNSTKALMTRNSGIFWALLQMSMFIGNLFVFFAFKNKETIDKSTRSVVIWTLSAVAMIGIVLLFFLPRPVKDEDDDDDEDGIKDRPTGPLEALVGAWKLFLTKKMFFLCFSFVYTGLELGFFSGVYSSCISFTEAFENRKELVGISGVFIGLGEVIGGAVFGIFGKKTAKWGRDPIVGLAFIIHAISFFLIFLNLPNDSPFDDTKSSAFITSNAYLAIFCSFMLGLGDACYNTQIYSLLGAVYSDNSAPAFAIFKFTQSIGATLSFIYAESLGLYAQLGILLALAIVGTLTFIRVEWAVKRPRSVAETHSE